MEGREERREEGGEERREGKAGGEAKTQGHEACGIYTFNNTSSQALVT